MFSALSEKAWFCPATCFFKGSQSAACQAKLIVLQEVNPQEEKDRSEFSVSNYSLA